MQICQQIVQAIEFVVDLIFGVLTTIVETVCGWVTTIVRTIVEVARRVCRALPWPLSALCGWVTDLVEVVTEVVEWICEEVIIRIIRWVHIIVTYIIYVVRWVCWVIDWPARLVDIFFCLIGVTLPRFLHVCVKIITQDDATNAATTRERVQEILREANGHLAQCNISICVTSIEFVPNSDVLSDVECGASQFFSGQFPWFQRNSCKRDLLSTCTPLTLYFVDSMAGSTNACTLIGTNYVLLTDGANGASVVHELGHHAALGHRDDPANIMFASASATKDQLTSWQCCMIRSSLFVCQIVRCFGRRGLGERVAGVFARRPVRGEG